VMNEETYGPLSGMSSFENTEEVIKMANSLPFGLAAYLYSDDLESAWRIADQLEFGAVGINVNDTSELQAPFGGWKMSGFGRELGVEGIHTYLEPKHLKIRLKMKHK
ncbi:MAG: aldehyde dehydrogenase family protein, partial [Deltaproteobacteria bacterium]|nr:aldehyde dehydrogenase family protein [Deltaproteobacteria bacterium]